MVRVQCVLLYLLSLLQGNTAGENSDQQVRVLLGNSGVEAQLDRPRAGIGQPYFDQDMSSNITAEIGRTAVIPCVVRQLGSKLVSWIRKRDSAILSAGDIVFTSETRIHAEELLHLNSWILTIRHADESDSGLYECQVSSSPKLSKIVHLDVIVPMVVIRGEKEVYAKSGSQVTLDCFVQSAHTDWNIQWYFRGKGESSFATHSSNKINNGTWCLGSIREEHAGEYLCTADRLEPVATHLIVLPGERFAEAMVRDGEQMSAARPPGPGLPPNAGSKPTFVVLPLFLTLFIIM